MENKKKIIAAVSAVINYIKTEEEACLQGAIPVSVVDQLAAAPPEPVKLWGISGRQTQMQTRNLMQLKAFHGVRFR